MQTVYILTRRDIIQKGMFKAVVVFFFFFFY